MPDFNYTCPVSGSLEELQTEPFVANLTFYHFNLILSGAAMAVSCLVCFAAIFLHATHLSKPGEQTKIAMFIPFYAIYSYLILAFPISQSYLLPWRDFVESIALCSFFLLLCEYISPSDDEREVFFAGLELPKKKNKKTGTSDTQDPLVWYRRKWIAVFQFPVVSVFVAIVTDVTEAAGRYCLTSFNIHFAHLWLLIISSVSLSITITAIFIFYKALKPQLAHQRPMAKFFAFKGIIGITFLINILFSILNGAGALNPTSKLNYADITVGIPTLIVLLILVPFSFFFHYGYSYHPYVIRDGHYAKEDGRLAGFTPTYQGGFLGCRAYIYAISPMEVLRGILFAFTLFTQDAQNRATRGNSTRLLNSSPGASPNRGAAAGSGYNNNNGPNDEYQLNTYPQTYDSVPRPQAMFDTRYAGNQESAGVRY